MAVIVKPTGTSATAAYTHSQRRQLACSYLSPG